MRYLRQISTYALLSVYGVTALLGYGLHLLAPEAHHHGSSHVACAGHDHHEHADHGARGHGCSESAGAAATCAADAPVLAGGEACEDDSCFVCEFLAQARSTAPHLTSAFVWHHVAVEVVEFSPQFAAETAQGLHVPRGPPGIAA